VHVVSVIGLKGGSTKSTLTAHLAVAAHHAGILTAIVDTDPQATLRMWSTRRQIDGPPVRPETTPEFLEPTLKAFEAQGAELIFIDTAGKAEIMGKRAAELSDLVLIPSRTSLADMDAVPTSHAMLKSLDKPHFVIFSDVDVAGRKNDVKEASKGFAARGIPIGNAEGPRPSAIARRSRRASTMAEPFKSWSRKGRVPRKWTRCSDGWPGRLACRAVQRSV
jgi:chromosome partitioning protein